VLRLEAGLNRRATERLNQVTVLNLGRTLAAGTPDEIRVHREVVNAYLGA
jgi:ABC-type branched-subunit amino acid transport system ATPase component